MTRRLILLRHGQTDWNAEVRWQGQADIELNETGRLQAKSAATALAAVLGPEPVRIVSSDLARAAETARVLGDRIGSTPSYDARLREIDVGRLSGLTRDEAVGRFGAGPFDYADHGGESDEQVRARMLPALEEIAAALADGGTAVVVGHGASLRIGAAALLGWSVGTAAALGSLDNCGWIELASARHTLHGTNGWRLTAYNRIAA